MNILKKSYLLAALAMSVCSALSQTTATKSGYSNPVGDKTNKTNGAYYTGEYRNLFVDVLGKTEAEVNAIMELFCKSVINESPELQKQGVRVKVMGDRAGFSEKVLAYIERIESETAAGERLTLVLAFNYSARSEMVAAVRRIASEVAEGRYGVEDITAQTISDNLLSAGIPDPDLMIRTSGECRLSNFLLWQSAYTELYFTEVLWPDFTEEEFERAIESYANRDRRFGLVKK